MLICSYKCVHIACDSTQSSPLSNNCSVTQTTFFIIVSSGDEYTEYLGGSPTFSGLVIGIPAFISGVTLVPLNRRDGGTQSYPFLISPFPTLSISVMCA